MIIPTTLSGDTSSWNDLIDYDCKLHYKNRDFWNVRLFFDGHDDPCYEQTPLQAFCAYESAKNALDELRMITCEMTDSSGDEYLVELLRIPPYTGSQIAYALKDLDGEFNYVWDDDEAYAISTLIYNVATKALSNYFKKDMKWAATASSNPKFHALGSYKITDFSLWEITSNGSVGLLFHESPSEAVEKAMMIIADVYWQEQMYTLYYRWRDPILLEAKIDNDSVEFPHLADMMSTLKEVIFDLLLKEKVNTKP